MHTTTSFKTFRIGKSRGLLLLLAAALVVASPTSTFAALLSPGSILFPVPAGVLPSGTIVAGPLVSPVAPATFQGNLTSEVLANDPTNPFPGGLTFLYQLQNTSPFPGQIERLTVTSFGGFATDVDYVLTRQGLDIPPGYADRSVATGDTVGFTFAVAPIGFGTLQPGDTSALLVVYTDATSWQPTLASVIDGSIASAPSYAPKSVIPEPGTLALAGLAAMGFIAVVRRRKS